MPKVFEIFMNTRREKKNPFPKDTLHFTSYNKLSGILVNSSDNIRKRGEKLNLKR